MNEITQMNFQLSARPFHQTSMSSTAYTRPEVATIGPAGEVIRGGLPKCLNLDPGGEPRDPCDCEFDE